MKVAGNASSDGCDAGADIVAERKFLKETRWPLPGSSHFCWGRSGPWKVAGSLALAVSMHDPIEGELAVLEIDRDHILRTEAAFEHQFCHRIFDLLLNRAL